MSKKSEARETQALAANITETAGEIARLKAQVAGMEAANQRRGVELAKRVQKLG